MIKTILAVLNIRSNEVHLFIWLFVHSFFIGFIIVFFEVAASSIFLTKFSVETIPYAYIGGAIVVTALGFICSKCEEVFSFSKSLMGSLFFLLVSNCIFAILLFLSSSRLSVMALFIWIDVIYVLLHIEFWGLAGRIFTVTQGKRLFALIGTGEVCAYIIMGLTIPKIVTITGAANLLFFSASGIIFCIVILFYILRSFSAQISSDEKDKKEENFSLKDMIKNKFLIFIIAISVISIFGYYFIDYAFYDRVEARYLDEKNLASFFGRFFAAVGIVNLIFKIFISGRLLSRFGLTVGLFALPSLLMLGSFAMIISGSLHPGIALLFLVAISTKLVDNVVRISIEEPSILILYQPFHAAQRLGAQTIVESIIEPVAGGVAGVILLVLSFLFNLQAYHIAYFMLLILAVWFTIAFLVRSEYPNALGKALSKRTLNSELISLDDGLSINVLKEGLKSPYIGEVIYCLNILEEIKHKSLDSFLINLLNHPSLEIRLDVLYRIERLNIVSAREAVIQRLKLEKLPLVVGALIRTYASLGGFEVIDRILPYLEHTEKYIKRGAIIGLLKSGGIQGVLLAGADLMKRVESENSEDRKFAAQVLGQIGIRDFYQPLVSLLRDEDLEVRKEALVSAGKLNNPNLWPLVVENLAVTEIYSTAVTALVYGGESTLPELERAFLKNKQNPELQCRIIRIYGQIRGNQVVKKLLENITVKNKKIYSQILFALSLCRYHMHDEDDTIIKKKIYEEISDAVWILKTLKDLKQVKHCTFLKDALNIEMEQIRNRIFFLLSFIYDSNSILQARDNLYNQSMQKRAYAIEIINNIISMELKTFIIPLIEVPLDDKSLNNLFRAFPQEKMAVNLRLQDIVKHADEWGDTWLQASALYAMANLFTKDTIDSIVSSLSHYDPLVRETAAWSLAKLDMNEFKKHINKLKEDPEPRVKNIPYSIKAKTLDKTLLTVNKVTFLKNTDIFAETPDNILASIAEQLKEIQVKSGDLITKQGEKGDNMYIITEGLVHVYNTEKSIAHFGPKDVIGELDIIDSNPRSFSAAAETETNLLCIDQSTFFTLISEQNEVTKGIIKVLCQRLRKTLRQTRKVEQAKLREEKASQPVKEEKEHSKEMFLPLEKILILKTVSFFSHIPDKILEEIISVIEEVKFQPGEKIVEKGAIGRWMYIIISGRVRIHDDKQTIAYQGDRTVFCETSVLYTEPYSVSITAEEETHLFRIEQEPLYELMADRFDLARGIIYSLTRRIRNLLEQQEEDCI